jgi:hypothetical protein
MFPYQRTSSPALLGHVLKRETEFAMSRETVTVPGGDGAERKLIVGQVIAMILFDIDNIAITPAGGNTGNGALGTLTLGTEAKQGDYAVTCVAASADGGTFQVVDPDGYRLPDATVGVAYVHKQLNFTITDGATDWAVGDSITVTVPEGSGHVVEFNQDAVDGTQRAHGFMAQELTVASGDTAQAQVIKRDAVAADTGLIWPADIEQGEKDIGLAQLAARNIQVRTGG